MAEALQREFSAREFNRDPSAVARAARRWGSVQVLSRGVPSLVVVDAVQHPEFLPSPAPTLLESLSMDAPWDDALIGEPPRARIALQQVEA